MTIVFGKSFYGGNIRRHEGTRDILGPFKNDQFFIACRQNKGIIHHPTTTQEEDLGGVKIRHIVGGITSHKDKVKKTQGDVSGPLKLKIGGTPKNAYLLAMRMRTFKRQKNPGGPPIKNPMPSRMGLQHHQMGGVLLKIISRIRVHDEKKF